jgi:hypothetical protein
MTPAERESSPSLAYAEDYNELRGQVIELLKGQEDLMPPLAVVWDHPTEGKVCRMRYAEFSSYLSVMTTALARTVNDEGPEPGNMFRRG